MKLVATIAVALATAWAAVAIGALITGCAGAPPRPEDRAVEVERLQRVVLVLGSCAAALGASSVANETGTAERAANYVSLGTCLVAGAIGIFGLPAFADPLPAEPIPEDHLGDDPPSDVDR